MATLNAYGQLTIKELANRKAPNGEMAGIVEVLVQENEILQDAIWLEANDTWSHKVVRRASEPTGTWRKLNSGVGVEASRTVTLLEQIGMLEAYSEPDKDLILGYPNPAQARIDEARSFIEGMGKTLATTLIYGNEVGVLATAETNAPEKFKGVASRLNALATTDNVLNAGGSGSDLTSIYIIQWGPGKVFMVYPKGDPFYGIKHTDLGEVTVSTSTTAVASAAQHQAYRDHFQVKAGLVVAHNGSIGRIANIETTGSTNLFDEDDLITLLNRMPNAGAGASIYVNKTVRTQMEIALKDKNNVNYTADGGEGLAGVPMMRFRGNPIRLVEKISDAETAET